MVKGRWDLDARRRRPDWTMPAFSKAAMLLLKSMRRRRPLYDHLSVDRPPTGLQHALLL